MCEFFKLKSYQNSCQQLNYKNSSVSKKYNLKPHKFCRPIVCLIDRSYCCYGRFDLKWTGRCRYLICISLVHSIFIVRHGIENRKITNYDLIGINIDLCNMLT